MSFVQQSKVEKAAPNVVRSPTRMYIYYQLVHGTTNNTGSEYTLK